MKVWVCESIVTVAVPVPVPKKILFIMISFVSRVRVHADAGRDMG